MHHPLRVLVADDEAPARDKVIHLLRRDPRFQVIGQARDGIEALEQLDRLRPEMMVLDIQMPGLSGFELLEALDDEVAPQVVFSTASDSYALRAFEVHAVDYLLKPYDAERFGRALDKAYLQRMGAQVAKPRELLRTALAERPARLVVKTVDGTWIRLALEDIVRVAAANKHVCVVTRSGQYLVRQAMRELSDRLDARFVRVHRGDIVNTEFVEKLEPWDHGDALLTLRDGTSLVLSRTYRKDLVARLG